MGTPEFPPLPTLPGIDPLEQIIKQLGYVKSDPPQFADLAAKITMDEYFPVQGWTPMTRSYFKSVTDTNEVRYEVYVFKSGVLAGNIEAYMQVWYDAVDRKSWIAEVTRAGMLSMRIFLDGTQVDTKPDYSTWPGIDVGSEYTSQVGYINIKIPGAAP